MPRILIALAVVCAWCPLAYGEDLWPKHITAPTQKVIDAGLANLAKTQTQDGNWINSRDGQMYPITMTSLAGMAFLANGNTPSRGPYAEQVRKAMLYVLRNAKGSGLITGSTAESGVPMYGHGFALLFLSSAYGMETDER